VQEKSGDERRELVALPGIDPGFKIENLHDFCDLRAIYASFIQSVTPTVTPKTRKLCTNPNPKAGREILVGPDQHGYTSSN
jgi:hypothetical protein